MKYHALFVTFEKAAKFEIDVCCKKLGGALRVFSLSADILCKQFGSSPEPIYRTSCPILTQTVRHSGGIPENHILNIKQNKTKTVDKKHENEELLACKEIHVLNIK